MASLQAKLADWERQAVEAGRKNLHLSSALDQVTESTIWKASWPIRRLGARVPVRHRQRARRWSIGSPETVQRILQAFASNPDLGTVVADGQMFGGRQSWVSNEVWLTRLFGAIGLWTRAVSKKLRRGLHILDPTFSLAHHHALSLSYDDFEPEPIPSEGTMAHAVERLITLVCHDAGMRVAQSGKSWRRVCREPSIRRVCF